jgi:hypothetical protein
VSALLGIFERKVRIANTAEMGRLCNQGDCLQAKGERVRG